MNIVVFNIAASSGGAITILDEYYNQAKQDKDNKYTFVVSCDHLSGCENVKIINLKWPKKNWIYRLFFDYFFASRLCRKVQANKVLSLQNIGIPFCRTPQTVYLQNSIQFSKFKIDLIKYPKLFIYRNLYKFLVVSTLRKAEKIIVQTQWMYEECKKYCNKDKIIIEKPTKIYDRFNKCEKIHNDSKIKKFFYPASPFFYKNQAVLVNAIKLIDKKEYNNIEVYFTCKGDENSYIKDLYDISVNNKLPIKFVGTLDTDAMAELYQTSTLVFPSYLESLGLPLLEARYFGAKIITTRESFSTECMEGYDNCMFFDYDNCEQLKECICKVLCDKD